ncbi:MAG: rhomboid family intramembrane serine protease [Planctomycetota bacterium]|nr:rhomboid family intramembrane serine protease [Planctomycetota bacterium]
MLLLLPIRTDSPIRRKPYVNYALIGLNAVVFVLTDVIGRSQLLGIPAEIDQFKMNHALDAARPEFFQFITYQFLHGDIFHLLGNMLFLWVFGNSVNSKMGNPAYALFFLAGGVFAGVGFAAENVSPLIGASGSIAAVTTAYLVLHPRSHVTIFYWLWFYIGTMHVQALLVIGVKIILYDNIVAPNLFGGGRVSTVAYSAHLYGYFFGFMLSLLMLVIKALPRDQYDILALWKRARQRSQMRTAMADPDARAQAEYGNVAKPVSDATGRPLPMATPVSPEIVDEVAQLRLEITELLGQNKYVEAAERYQSLIAKHADQCLPRNQLMDVANQLTAMQRYPQAASAYEKYLTHYPTAVDAQQTRLMLGIIYARYLQQFEPAQRHLEKSLDTLTNDQQRRQANKWLDTARNALGAGPSTA